MTRDDADWVVIGNNTLEGGGDPVLVDWSSPAADGTTVVGTYFHESYVKQLEEQLDRHE